MSNKIFCWTKFGRRDVVQQITMVDNFVRSIFVHFSQILSIFIQLQWSLVQFCYILDEFFQVVSISVSFDRVLLLFSRYLFSLLLILYKCFVIFVPFFHISRYLKDFSPCSQPVVDLVSFNFNFYHFLLTFWILWPISSEFSQYWLILLNF